jgi:hypothetical protein
VAALVTVWFACQASKEEAVRVVQRVAVRPGLLQPGQVCPDGPEVVRRLCPVSGERCG